MVHEHLDFYSTIIILVLERTDHPFVLLLYLSIMPSKAPKLKTKVKSREEQRDNSLQAVVSRLD